MTKRMMVQFDLKTTDQPWDEDASWLVVDTVKVKDSGDHLTNWKKAAKAFRQQWPDVMAQFGDGSVAVVLRREE